MFAEAEGLKQKIRAGERVYGASVPVNCRTMLYLAATATLFGLSISSGAAEPTPSSLQAVRYPCSLFKVAEELSWRYDLRVFLDPALTDMRVVWAFHPDVSIDTILVRLAELTDSQVTSRPAGSGKRRFTLERPARTTQAEEAWRTAALTRTFRELLRASSDYEHGKLDTSTFSPNLRVYLERLNTAPGLKLLTRLMQEQMSRLMQGEEIRFPPGATSEADVRQIMVSFYRKWSQREEWKQEQAERAVDQARQDGTGLRIDFDRNDGCSHLKFIVGESGGHYLCRFGDEELGLPLSRRNPYRLLEAGIEGGAEPQLPAVFDQPLAAPVVVTRGGDWNEVVEELARATGLDVISDGYLSRDHSRRRFAPGQKQVLVPAGTPLAGAMDLVCEKYGYLWWQKDGCVYLRARAWVWDMAYEVPERFLDTWTTALTQRGAVGTAEMNALAAFTPLQLNGLDYLGGRLRGMSARLDRSEVGAFLRFFRALSPPPQAHLLGPGLLVDGDQVAPFGMLILRSQRGTLPRTLLLRLTQRVETDQQAVPPTTKVILKLDAPKEPVFTVGFVVALPLLPEPFNP